MDSQIVLLLLIVALIIYSIFLQIRLTQKNIFIESTVKRLSVIEKSRNMEEMMAFLSELQKLSQYSSYFTDKLLEKETTDFIFENEKELRIFMHYTHEETDAKNIIQQGFRFADSFYKTALHVTKDKLDLKIKHNSKKYYGDFIIIICISNDIANFFSMEINKAGITGFSIENILTEIPPARNDNSDLVYQLSSRFVKGYINYRTGEIVKNPFFDPWYNSPEFQKNLNLLKSNK
jgi:hypothetical protein